MVAQVITKPENTIIEDEDNSLFGKPITKSQIAIIRLVAEGMRNKEIAATLCLSPRTVEVQIFLACKRLGIHNRTSLLLWAKDKMLN